MAGGAQAATFDVIGGQLFGASGVDVGGTLYDVEFLDGSCITLFNGCDDVSDFTFQTSLAASVASQALLDQVFLDGPLGNFDSSPNLTNGCSIGLASTRCWSLTPYGPSSIFPPYSFIHTDTAKSSTSGSNSRGDFVVDSSYETLGVANTVYAL